MRAALATETIGDAASLTALEPEWWALWRHVPSATPFQSPAWLIPWWRHFHPGELFAVTVRRGERLVGLAPFYIEDGALGRRLLPVGISLSDYLDVLLDPDHLEEAGQALVDHLVRQRECWDEWSLEELAPQAVALALPVPPGCEERLTPQSACPVLTVADGQTAEAASPERHRRNLRLARNRAARRGGIAVEQGTAASASGILDHLFRLHRARWQSRGQDGVLADDAVQSFQRDAVPGLIEANLLRLYLMHIGDEPAAAYYGFVHEQRAYGYLTGFDPDYSFESPGLLLWAHAIEQAVAENVREFHFLRGPEPYKYAWGAVDRWNMRRSFRRCVEDAHA
jgi:CelD/BcsL family acetyltransferase involved in cellulose biosynthesis